MSVETVRSDLAEALEGPGWNVYAYPPAVVTPPAVIIVPDEPYLALQGLGRRVQVRVRFRVTCAVAALDNPASLAQLERLLVGVYQRVPAGASSDTASRPSMTSVGPSDLLTSDLTVEVVTSIAPDPDPEP